MKRMFKQWMAELLAAVLVLTLLPAAALADQPDGEAELPAQETAEPAPEPEEAAPETAEPAQEEAAPEAELTALEDVPMAIAATPFLNNGGNGSVGDSYQIANLDQLEAFRDYINDRYGIYGSSMYFKLTASIDMSEKYNADNGASWTPIGTDTVTSFQGTFDGAGFSISGLYINTGSNWQGLFGCVENGTVQNLAVSGSVTGQSYVGGIAGDNVGGTISNCHNDCAVNGSSSSVGGIAGDSSGTIQNCYNMGTIGGDSWMGGIVGKSEGGTVKDCYNAGAVNSDSIFAGAVVGINNSGVIQNCYYLEGSCARASQGGTLKTAEEFKSGEVAWLLQNGQGSQAWGQTLGDEADEYPVLTNDSGKKVYKVTFQADGAEYAARYANPNGTVTLPEDPTKENYTFVKWAKTQATNGDKFDETTAVTGDMTVYAVGQANFGGESGEIPLNVTCGQEVTANLDDYMAYENEDILPEGKFTYSIARDEDSTGARINGNTLTVPAGPNVGDHVITITAKEKAPEYALMSVDSYGAADVTLTVKVSVAKATATVNPPTASAPLIYSGGAQALVTAGSLDCGGSVGCGTMKYSLTGGEDYVAAVPTAQDVGTYTVYWKVDGMVPTNCDYVGQTSGQISVTIHKSATPFLNNGGDGSVGNPYQIANPEQLKAFRDYINKDISSSSGAGGGGDGEYFKLTNNIDLENEEWTPIGTNAACKFRGVFDGDWHEISGLYISYGSYAGLFGRSSGTIQNLTVSGSVNGSGFFGGLVGDNDGGTISNCGNKCAVNGSDSYVGGIAGENGGTIQNCYNAGVVSGTIIRGGIAGQNEEGSKVENCYNVGTVNNTESTLVGGVVGYANGTIQNCYYLDTCGAGNGYDDKNSVSKSAEEFKSGEVAWLLQNGQGSQVWGQKLGDGGDDYPVLTTDVNQKVCKVTFATQENESCAVRYANYNKTVATLPEEKPTKEHYTFAKWSQSNAADGVAFTTETKVTGDMTVYAVAQENFGGDSDTISLSAVYGQGATLDLSAHMAYENESAAKDKFTYTIEGENSTKFQIAGDTLTVPKTLDAGDYTLTITAKEKTPEYALVSVVDYGAEDVTLTVQVSVTRATATVTPPTAKTELHPSDAPQKLIDPGSVACDATGWGTMKYSLTGGSDYTTTIPTAQEAGTYTVYWKIDGANETNFDYVGGTSGQVTAAIHRSSDPFLNDGGSGSEGDPYQIANLEQLESFRDHINSTGGGSWYHFKLTADIDMSEKYGADKGASWTPIGTSDHAFSSSYFYGEGHTISGLYVASGDYAGLFGNVGHGGLVQNLAVSGTVTGGTYVGGIAGYNTGDIKNCHSDCAVSGPSYVGGIVGYNGAGSGIGNCYSVGPVSGDNSSYMGGIVGDNYTSFPSGDDGIVTNCYYRDDCGAGGRESTPKTAEAFKSGEVAWLLQNGQGSQVWGQKLGDGGDESPVLTSSEDKKVYQITGEVEGQDSIVWYSNSTATLPATKPTKEYFTFAGWAKTPGAAAADFTAGETVTDNMTVYAVWDLALAGSGEAETPYEIADLEQLEAVREYVNGGRGAGEYFKLTASIDMSDKYGADKGEGGISWTPIGTESNKFQGTFDGGDFTISGLYINWVDYSGLFGYSSGTIQNLTVSGSVSGNYVGGIVGYNYYGAIKNCHNEAAVSGANVIGGIAGSYEGSSMIENCYNSGTITGTWTWAGGIVGRTESAWRNIGTVKNCYNAGTVSGRDYVGGIVGRNWEKDSYSITSNYAGYIQNCYNVGTVSGTEGNVGGIVGYNNTSSNLTNCYYLATCGAAGEGTAKTAEEFNSGEVAWLLQNGQETQVWGQKLSDEADEYPVLTSEESEKVLKVTFATEENKNYAARYANPNGTVTLPDEPTNENFAFTKWVKTKAADGEEFNEKTAVTSDMTVYAVSQPSFGGDSDTIPVSAVYGQGATLDLSEHMAYQNGSAATGKFTYTIEGEDSAKFQIEGDTLTVPKDLDAGDYTLSIKAEEKAPEYALMSVVDYGAEPVTLTVKVTIDKAASTATPPTANVGLAYTGAAQALVTAGSAEGGTVVYALGDSATDAPVEGYEPTVPTVANAGTYYVWWKVQGDKNHNDTDSVCLTVSIAQAAVTVTAPTANAGLTYTGAAQALIAAGKVESDVEGCGTMQYSLDGDAYSADLPTGEGAKTYTVYWKVDGANETNYAYSGEISGQVTVTGQTADEAAAAYNFTQDQRTQLVALQAPENNDLWLSLLYGFSGSSGAGAGKNIVYVALSQIGNVGGQPYWSWYGFSSREEWCACFVSWCANECGYIDSGAIPKFAGCGQGSQWFKSRGQWAAGNIEPVSGMLIFFDWDKEDGGQDGSPDHVGIVARVENGVVYTVEGNSGDACRERHYAVGHYEIFGYGIPSY